MGGRGKEVEEAEDWSKVNEDPLSDTQDKLLEEEFLSGSMHVDLDAENSEVEGDSRGKKRTSDSSERRNVKLSKMDAFLDRWTTALTAKEEAYKAKADRYKSSSSSGSANRHSISVCMDLLEKVEGVSSTAYNKTIEKFLSADWRQIFVGMSDARRKDWLDSLSDSSGSSNPSSPLEFMGKQKNKNLEECSTKRDYDEPFIGQVFHSEEEAFVFYKKYAIRHGFSIKKGRVERKDGEVKKRDFFCHRYGRQPLKVADPTKKQRNRKSLKCECKAHLHISLHVSLKEWRVTNFVMDHNHELLSPHI
ncbi:hypothetical protein COLO4_13994 [Corchorus olitorius]|uniref:FAR1 domain-containing protein n=1 Tax=Corchorus olitorius TaxID=93759 RepID=A0A1R3JU41_9ROSI|nr:hypothetical protein COLO4_13994 [Corchorus olitorius]